MKHNTKITALMTAVILLTGCWENNHKTRPDSPEAVVEAFNRAITAGDFDKALSLSDSTTMINFIESYHEAWNSLLQEDSTVLSIASDILSGAVIEIDKIEKDGHDRVVFYRLEADGKSKERKATVRKEEGEWKIAAITNAN